MTIEQFEQLVRKLELEAARRPTWYKIKIWLLAMFANFYIAFICIVVLCLLATSLLAVVYLKFVAIKLFFIIAPVLWLLLESLSVSVPAPQGMSVTRKQAPDLFSLLDELRASVRAPKVHEVLLVDEFNASVCQTPRLGVLGWYKNHLLLGLPLMKSLSREQLKAVLAHELGHLSAGHGRFSHWAYRQRKRWEQLYRAFDSDQGRGSFLILPFLRWFSAYFNAYSFPLARADEYQADLISAQATSPKIVANTLTWVSLINRYLGESYWPGIYRQAHDKPEPGFAPYMQLGEHIGMDMKDVDLNAWLDSAMQEQTGVADTHPSLRDRLANLGTEPSIKLSSAAEMADAMLGERGEWAAEKFDLQWQNRVARSWRDQFQRVQQERTSLAALDEQASAGEVLEVEQAFVRAMLTESTGNDPAAAIDQLEQLCQRVPGSAKVCFHLGRLLLERDDVRGVEPMQRSMALDVSATVPASQLLRNYFLRQGDEQTARSFHEKLVEREHLELNAEHERNSLSLDDVFEPHGLSLTELQQMQSEIRKILSIKHAYFVKKRMKLYPEKVCYVLGYTFTGRYGAEGRSAAEAVYPLQNGVHFPGETIIVCVDGIDSKIKKKILKTNGAKII